MTILQLLVMTLLVIGHSETRTVVRTVDMSGAPFPNVLVIVGSLDGKGEIARYLTDQSGHTPPIPLDAGLYRLIVTCPYGLCRTAIHEFLGSNAPSEMVTKVDFNPPHANGEVFVGTDKIRLVLLGHEGRPEVGAHVLIRDRSAKWEKWYVTDDQGSATVELVDDPAVLVIIWQNTLSEEVGLTCEPAYGNGPPTADCRKVKPWEPLRLQLGKPNSALR
jgi:hypothetical protein